MNIPSGLVRFNGEPRVYYMVLCTDCDMALPFHTAEERDEWIFSHVTTRNCRVEVALDVRPDGVVTWSESDNRRYELRVLG